MPDENANNESSVEDKKPDVAEHTTRDIYLAAFCMLNECSVELKTTIGETHVIFVAKADIVKLKALVKGYFDGTASCNPKALKFSITDLKNQMFSVLDSR